MLLLLFSICVIHMAVYGRITSNVNDIICNKSQTDCNINCGDSSIHCHDISVYSSSNRTLINCQQESSCSNIQIHCQQTNECILRCDHGACFNSTLICNTNVAHSVCECRGVGCPSIPGLTNTMNIDSGDMDDDQYTVDQSLVIIFFVAFFAVVLCCFCVLVVALCMSVLYFSERKKQENLCRHIDELTHNKKISFLSSSTSKDKYDKSEATLNVHRMTLSRSNKNRSYDATVSAMVTDDIDDKEHQMLMMSPATDDIITIKTYGMKTRGDSEEKIDMEQTMNMEHNEYVEEEQKEGDKADLRLKRFDSEDLYIMQPQSTLQYRVNYNESTPILDKNNGDDSGSDYCIQHSDHDSGDNVSAYTMDGHNVTHRLDLESDHTDHIHIDIVHGVDKDINVDISAQLPTSPGVYDGIQDDNTVTSHPPKQALLRPPTVGKASPKYHGTQNSDAGSNTSEDSEFSLCCKKEEEEEDEKEGINHHRLNRMGNHLQPIPETMNHLKPNNKASISLTTCATYHASGDYKDAIHALHNPLPISRSSPPPQSRSVSQSTSESTFTIKSAAGTGNNSELSQSRQSMSLNSAAAVCIAFPDTNNKKISYHHKIPRAATSVPNYVQKHKHYYHHNTKRNLNLSIFEGNKLRSVTPLNSPMEKPIIISKAPSTTAMVPSLPSSPRTSMDIEEEDDPYALPSSVLMIPHPMSDDTVMRSRGKRNRNANNERKTRSRSKSKTRGTRSASNDTICYRQKDKENKRNNLWKRHHRNRHHEAVASYSEQTMDHNITLLEPHIISEILDDSDEEKENDHGNNNDDGDGDNDNNKEGGGVHDDDVNITYRATSKSTGNIVHQHVTNTRKIKIKRNSKPIIKVYRNNKKKKKLSMVSNIVLPTNEFNKNGMNGSGNNVAQWNTTIMMTPPPPPIVLGHDKKKRARSQKKLFSAASVGKTTPLAAIIPSQSSFNISNIIK